MASSCNEIMDNQGSNTLYPVCSDLTKVPDLLKEFGVCVIPDVFSNLECDNWMKDILSSMEVLSDHQVNHMNPDGWTEDKLPPVLRYGLYQHLINNLKPVWEIRRDPRMKEIFKRVYSELRGEEVDEFVCSLDGINVQPNVERDMTGEKDWPHCDQTRRDDIFKCVQGQVVLTNTAASFRASPTSHRHFLEIMELAGFADNNYNWAKFNDEALEKITKNVILPNNVPFQIPIRSTKGSVILWLSTTIHSAMSSGFKETATDDDPYKGWRGVVYVCYRPRCEFSVGELKVLEECLQNNLGTNHWATYVNKQQRGGTQAFSSAIERLLNNPQLVYKELKFKPDISSCLINEPITMTAYEEEVKTEEGQESIPVSAKKSAKARGGRRKKAM